VDERLGEPVGAGSELLVGEALLAIDDADAVGEQAA
jgi:hypothetical protein